MERYSGTGLQHPQVLEGLLSHFVQVFWRIFVLGGLDSEMELAVGLVGIIETVCFWDVAIELFSDCQAGFVCP